MRKSLLLCVVACSSAAKPSLTRVDAEASCIAGGVRLNSGIDDNGNGTLDDAEIESSQVVCSDVAVTLPSGQAPTPLLLVRTEDGEPGCLRMLIGFDNGEGGSTALDNTLQDGEVDETRVICQDAPALRVGSFDVPTDPVGTASIVVGPGSGIGITSLTPSYGGHIKLFRHGSVDTTLPAPPDAPSTGPRSCDAPDGSATLPTGSTKPASGLVDDCWIRSSDNTLMKDQAPASGLFVSPDASLTIRTLRVDGPIVNEGEIKSTSSVLVTTNAYFGEPASRVETRQLSFNVTTFVNQGDVVVHNGFQGEPLTINARYVFSNGRLDTHGGDDNTGGSLTVTGTDGVLLGGTVDAQGSGLGAGGEIRLTAGARFISSAAILAHGGLGNNVIIRTVDADARIGGRIDTHGQNTAAGGFQAGDVDIEVIAGSLHLGASIDARGGIDFISNNVQATGGSLTIAHAPGFGDELILAGITSIDTGGGTEREIAGSVTIGAESEASSGVGGAIIHDIPIIAHGANVTFMTWLAGPSVGVDRIISSADIVTNERDQGGSVRFRAKDDISSSATVIADGNRTVSCIAMTSILGNISHSGTSSCSGTEFQPTGGSITLAGAQVTQSGALVAHGIGGGAGGLVQLASSAGDSVVTGSIDVAGGPTGSSGVIVVD